MLPPLYALLLSLVCGLAAAVTVGPVLRAVPEPALDPDDLQKVPYAELATRRTAVACLCWAVGLSLVAALTVPTARLGPWVVLALVGSLASVIDIATTWIPRALLHAGWALMLLTVLASAWLVGETGPVVSAAAGSAITGGLFWVVWEVAARTSRQLLGFADVRLGFLAGAVAGWLGWQAIGSALVLGCLAGAVWGAASLVARRRDGPFPYGPSIVLGPFLALLVLNLNGL